MKPLINPSPFPKRRLAGALGVAGLSLWASVLYAAVPPDPTVELRFPEGPADAGGNGVTTTNTGTLAGSAAFAQPVDPVWETNLSTGSYVSAGNNYSLYFGPIIGNSLGGSHGRAADLIPDSGPGFNSIGAYPKLTVCGWVNATGNGTGGGGNRIA